MDSCTDSDQPSSCNSKGLYLLLIHYFSSADTANQLMEYATNKGQKALAISGAMTEKMYGAPVMPFQPEGIWSSPYDGNKWKQSEGENQYRRAVYTFWKRTSPYPALMTFDGAGRESCSSRRIRTNTPLQALNTMNDPVYMDLSKKLTERVWSDNSKAMIKKAYQLATYTDISDEKLEILNTLYPDVEISIAYDGGGLGMPVDMLNWLRETIKP